MSEKITSRPRVLLANLDLMVRIGLTRVLADGGLHVLAVDGESDALVEDAKRLRPDSIVLALGAATPWRLREQVRLAAPRAKVILWARDETEMEVFDPGLSVPRRISNDVSEALLAEIGAHGRTEGRE